jgi:2-polyprenyl-6-methoxyphenol hydroxylase-like FAD-dependent oxidoreductase
MAQSNDVLIVGAGPSGLLLAGDLAAAGVACTVLERRAEESNLTRAFAVHARTLELLDARGVADELVTTGQRVGAVQLFGRVQVYLSRLPSRFPFVLVTPQYETERVLEERARGLGAEIVGGAEVVGLRQDADGVEVDVRGRDGAVEQRRAAWVVGADGVHSAVRPAVGLPFPGRSVVRSVMLADVRLGQPPANVLPVAANGKQFAFLAPFGDGWYRVIAWDRRHQLPDSAPVKFDEVRDVTRRVFGSDLGMHDPRWMSRFHSDERQVPHYRVGRVFLVGDAAHVHSPAGGQGMNTGLQDAANLSWKLAATIGGWAPPGLLDTYHDERHPVGRMVVRLSGTILRLVLLHSRVLRAVRGGLAGAAARFAPVSTRIAGMISGIAIGYRMPHGAHKLAGTRAPDLPLVAPDGKPSRLYEALRAGRFVLLAPAGDPAASVGGWEGRVEEAAVRGGSGTVMLVRPDGYVAWASDETDPERRAAAVRAALADACGAPAARTTT